MDYIKNVKHKSLLLKIKIEIRFSLFLMSQQPMPTDLKLSIPVIKLSQIEFF